jgi:hypothetical protein
VFLFDKRLNTADAGAEEYADALAVDVVNLNRRLLHRLVSCHGSQLLVAITPARLTPAKVNVRFEVLHFTETFSHVFASGNLREGAKSGLSSNDRLPGVSNVVTQRRYQA